VLRWLRSPCRRTRPIIDRLALNIGGPSAHRHDARYSLAVDIRLRPLTRGDIPGWAGLLARIEVVDRTGEHFGVADQEEEMANPEVVVGKDFVGAFDGPDLVGYYSGSAAWRGRRALHGPGRGVGAAFETRPGRRHAVDGLSTCPKRDAWLRGCRHQTWTLLYLCHAT